MSWNEISPELRKALQQVCTARELDLLKLRAAHPDAGRRPLAAMLGVSDTRVRDLDRSIRQKLHRILHPESNR